jgi:hypothetical protein
MKKNKLIALLNSIEGNPDIVLWNGFVNDYQDISTELIDDVLVKRTLQEYLQHVELERARDAKDWDRKLSDDEIIALTKRYNQIAKWELNDYITEDDIKQKRYSAKKIVFLQAKLRGVDTFDRLGTLRY